MIFSKINYKSLCIECDKLLENNNIYRVSNDWLHLNRPHPIFLRKYLILEYKFLKFYFSLILIFLGNILKIIRSLFGSIFFLHDYILFKRSIESTSNLYFSHLVNDDSRKQIKDFYYRDFPSDLINNEETIFLYLNHLGIKFFRRRNKKKIILPRFLPIHLEILLGFKMFIDALGLLKMRYSNRNKKRIHFVSFVESISPSSINNIRFHYIVKGIIKKTNAKNVVTTFEGHAWERIIYNTVKKYGNGVRTFGYQNTFIFNHQHSIKRNLHNGFDPDFIICKGEGPLNFFKKNKFLPQKRLINIGSDYYSKSTSNKIKNKDILILPEADFEECKILFEMTLNLSKVLLSSKFYFRLHPSSNKKKFHKYISKFIFSRNIIISNLSFEEDLIKTQFCLYRGSTAVLQAINYGLFVIYVDTTNLNIDILSSLELKSFKLKKYDEIHKIINMKSDDIIEFQSKTQKALNKYFSPKNNKYLIKIFSKP
tara:strand:- start:8706 stop:10151 length:1446 start_codon:yes stop_codon:yes gene_type:complete